MGKRNNISCRIDQSDLLAEVNYHELQNFYLTYLHKRFELIIQTMQMLRSFIVSVTLLVLTSRVAPRVFYTDFQYKVHQFIPPHITIETYSNNDSKYKRSLPE